MPLYDKTKYLNRMIAKFMWFKIIEYAINRKDINWVDMWSCPYNNSAKYGWRDIITNRNKYNLIAPYKYRFLSIKTKNNPDKEPNYIITCNKNGLKSLKVKGGAPPRVPPRAPTNGKQDMLRLRII